MKRRSVEGLFQHPRPIASTIHFLLNSARSEAGAVLNGSVDFLRRKKLRKGYEMRYVTAFCLFVLLNAHRTEAQVFPASNGSCAIDASGLMDCDWISAVTLRGPIPKRPRSELFVTRCMLAPGAPLNPLVGGREVLIVGLNAGEVINEKRSPQQRVNVSKGLVMLISKKEPFLLRNIGKEILDLLVIEVRK
jgi:hypothetical protein